VRRRTPNVGWSRDVSINLLSMERSNCRATFRIDRKSFSRKGNDRPSRKDQAGRRVFSALLEGAGTAYLLMPLDAGAGAGAGELLAQAPRPNAAATRAINAIYFMLCDFPPFWCWMQRAEIGGSARGRKLEVRDSLAGGGMQGCRMDSEQRPPPPVFIVVLIVIVNVLVIGVMSATGALQRLSPGAQFYYGIASFGFPVLVYWIIRTRR
jgi:hypothetical protein